MRLYKAEYMRIGAKGIPDDSTTIYIVAKDAKDALRGLSRKRQSFGCTVELIAGEPELMIVGQYPLNMHEKG